VQTPVARSGIEEIPQSASIVRLPLSGREAGSHVLEQDGQ